MRHLFLTGLLLLCASLETKAQHVFRNTSLSDALIELDASSKRYEISFVYNELEDFTVTTTVGRRRSLPDAVRDVCGFYPVRVSVRGRDILVECMQKDRTKLIGRLTDANQQPIAYANITLYADSTLIGGGVSNEVGDFVIPCSAAQARVHITCVGFKAFDKVLPIKNVGTLRMQMDNHYLENVSISGHMPLVRHEDMRLVYLVSRDAMARGLDAQELLSRVPTVSVFGGQASILGKGTARFMINGHVVAMDEESIRQKLWTMHSEDIERIEVLSIPSGRYQDDAAGGFINIVLRRDPSLGWRSDVNTRFVSSDDWGGRVNASVGYVSEKFDMSVNIDGGRTTGRNKRSSVFEGLDREETLDNRTTDKDVSLSAMLHYLPVKNIDLGAMLAFKEEWQYQDIESNLRQYQHNAYGNPTDRGEIGGSRYTVKYEPNKPIRVPSLSTYADWMLDSLGKKLSLSYSFYRKKENVETNIWDQYAIYGGVNGPRPLWCNAENAYTVNSVKLDVMLPFRFMECDAGLSYTDITLNDDLLAKGYTYVSINDDYNYSEHTLAAYCSLHKDLGRLKATAGLRYERTHLNDQADSNGNYNHYLPTLRLSYRLADRQQIVLNWGMAIHRPNFNSLNPVQLPETRTTIVLGNPTLRPSQTNNVELSYSYNQGIHAVLYHQHGRNQVEWLRFNDTRSIWNGFNYIQPYNCYKSDKTGFLLRCYRQIVPWMVVMGEGDVHHYLTYADEVVTMSESLLSYPLMAEGWTKRLAVETNFVLNRRHSIIFDARYDHIFSQITGLTEYGHSEWFRFALRGSFLEDRLKLSLILDDPFCQHVTDYVRKYKKYDEKTRMNYHSHAITLTASYSLVGKKVRRTQQNSHAVDMQRSQKQNIR